MKQISVVDMIEQDLDLEMKLGTKMIVNWDMYKEMHKEEHRKTFNQGLMSNFQNFEQYYNETFNSKEK